MPPLVGTRGAASAKAFGWTVSSISGIGGWIARTTENYGIQFGIYGDSTNGIFFCASDGSGTVGRIGLLSFNGTLSRQYNFFRPSVCCNPPSGNTSMIAGFSSGITYTGASTSAVGDFILRLSSSNTFLNGWRVASPGVLAFQDIQPRANGSVIVAGYQGANNCYIHITDASAASFDVSKLLSGSSAVNYLAGIALDSSENIILALSNTNTNQPTRLVKINNTSPFLSTFSWRKDISAAAGLRANSVICDSSNNIYVHVTVQSSPAITALLKFDSSGNFVWGRQLNINNTTNDIRNNRLLSLDSSGNVYMMWFSSASGTSNVILKFDSSGTLQWQRQIRTVSGSGSYQLQPRGVYVSGNYMYLAFYLAGFNNPFVWKLPIDGSGENTYVLTSPSYTFAYEASSFTDSSYSPIIANVTSPSLSNTSNTPSSYTPSDNTNQNTWVKTVI